jgi:hypothetical protein
LYPTEFDWGGEATPSGIDAEFGHAFQVFDSSIAQKHGALPPAIASGYQHLKIAGTLTPNTLSSLDEVRRTGRLGGTNIERFNPWQKIRRRKSDGRADTTAHQRRINL